MSLKRIIPIRLQEMIEAVIYKSEIREAKLVKKLLKKSFLSSDAKCASEYQHQKLADFFSKIRLENSYYAKLLSHFNFTTISDLQELPLLDKSMIRKNFKRLISGKRNILNSFYFNTGGSTGEPLQFYASRLCGLVDRYHQIFLFELSGYKIGQRIVAFDGSVIPVKQKTKGIFWQLKTKRELPYGSYHFSSHYFNKNTENEYINKFMELKPDYLRGYPSFISLFSDAIVKKSIEVSFVKGIHLTAENIYQHQIESIAHVFKCPVYRQYGHSEMAIYGFCLPQSEDYLCSPYYGITEVVNENGRHVKLGESGEIVVTGFHNHIMPLVRYRTGDYAVYGGDFNGFTVLKQIIGRTQDFLIGKDGTKVPVTGLVFGQHFHAFKNIIKWQLLQKEPGKIDVLIVPTVNYSKDDEQEILMKLSEGKRFTAKLRYVDDINLTQRGKMQFVINYLLRQ